MNNYLIAQYSVLEAFNKAVRELVVPLSKRKGRYRSLYQFELRVAEDGTENGVLVLDANTFRIDFDALEQPFIDLLATNNLLQEGENEEFRVFLTDAKGSFVTSVDVLPLVWFEQKMSEEEYLDYIGREQEVNNLK